MSRRRVVGISLAIVLVLGLLFGVSRGLAYLGFPDPLDVFRPSIADVLDGRVVKADPAFRIDRMNAFAAELEARGVHQDASSLALRCEEGQDGLTTRDPYRFRCQVEYVGYHGWSGDFATGAQALIAAMPPECGGASETTLAPTSPLVVVVPGQDMSARIGAGSPSTLARRAAARPTPAGPIGSPATASSDAYGTPVLASSPKR